MCTPALAWTYCNSDYGTKFVHPIRCTNGSSVDLLAETGCIIQGGVVAEALTVPCPSTYDEVTNFTRTIYDPNSYGGPGCANATITFYVENTGGHMT